MMEDKAKTVVNFHQMELDDRILKVSVEVHQISNESMWN